MKLSTRARYGTRALLDIAAHSKQAPVPLKDIAQREGLSLLYLEHIVTPLIAAGILRSTRGPRGGVRLAKDPSEIKLSEVIRLLEGSIAPAECIDNPSVCSRSSHCTTRDLWNEIGEAMDEVLQSTTLQDMVERQRKKEQPQPAMYYV